MKLYSNEIVFKGHPDKVCDQISDTILDECLKQDPYSRVAVEAVGGKGKVFVTGEITTKAELDIEKIVKCVLKEVGYNADKYEIIDNIGKQSPDIALGVDTGGAGDQGMMFGYACNDTEELLPLAQVILQRLSKEYYKLTKRFGDYLADGKAQITGYYDDDFKLIKIKTFTISYQNSEINREFTDTILKGIVKEICEDYNIEIEEFLINPTGKFLVGGFEGDAGLTGRKIVVDTYHSFANVGGGAFCVDGETEYLTRGGWKTINNYNEGTEIAQWNNGKLEFVIPNAYIECDAKNMYRIYSPTAFDMVLSDKHDIVLRTSKGNIIKKQLRELLDENGYIKNGNSGSVPMYFKYNNENIGIDLSDDLIRLQIAFCADGSILESRAFNGRIRIKKSTKKHRLEQLLNNTNTNYKISEDGDYLIYYFNPPILTRSLYDCFKNANNKQFEIIADEVFRWDGSTKDKVYRTTQKQDADFIQFVLMSVTGYRVSIGLDDRIGELMSSGHIRKSICYEVRLCKNKYSHLRYDKTNKLKIDIKPFTSTDGKMYCFSVDSGMLILRRNNKVFITGNSGKDPSKVDRSGAYKARQIAIRYLKQYDLKWCEVQLSYAIGKAVPLAIYIDSNIGNIEPTDKLYEECKPLNIIKDLDLRKPIFRETAKFGHFGNKNFTWECL